jgi:hypothetical protein
MRISPEKVMARAPLARRATIVGVVVVNTTAEHQVFARVSLGAGREELQMETQAAQARRSIRRPRWGQE